MTSFFGGKDKAGGAATENGRVSRIPADGTKYCIGCAGEESLRVLDIGPTSSTNINFITELGHSIYLANLVEDAAKNDWSLPQENGEGMRFDVDRFLAAHLNFSGRGFDVVLFWDTADYLPQELLVPGAGAYPRGDGAGGTDAGDVPSAQGNICIGGGEDGLPPLPPDCYEQGGRATSG